MAKTIDWTIKEYTEKIDSADPTPGGGSSGAITGMLGAATARMYAYLSFGKKSYLTSTDEQKKTFEESFSSLSQVRDFLGNSADNDSRSYQQLMDAYHLPKETEEQVRRRTQAIQSSLVKAADVPLGQMQASLTGIRAIIPMIPLGSRGAIADGVAGAEMLCTCAKIAYRNVRSNAALMKDENLSRRYLSMAGKMLQECTELTERIEKEADGR